MAPRVQRVTANNGIKAQFFVLRSAIGGVTRRLYGFKRFFFSGYSAFSLFPFFLEMARPRQWMVFTSPSSREQAGVLEGYQSKKSFL